MAQVFITRVHGFDPARWPAISFGKDGLRDKLLRESRLGDVIAFVATHGEEVEPADRGRLLGLAEIGRKPVDTLDLIDRTALRETDWNSDGTVRWPKSLTMTRAWRHAGTPPPDIRDVLGRQLTYSATYQAQLLTRGDAELIRAQPWTPVPVHDSDAMRGQQTLGQRAGPTTGPPPGQGTHTVTHERGDAQVYAMRFGKRAVWKIGYAKDPKARLAQINQDVPHEVLDEAWSLAYTSRPMPDGEAYAFEQAVLRRLAAHRTERERVVCPEDVLRRAWYAALGLQVA